MASGWAVSAAILLERDRPIGISELARLVMETRLTGLGANNRTGVPSKTLRTQLTSNSRYTDWFSVSGNWVTLVRRDLASQNLQVRNAISTIHRISKTDNTFEKDSSFVSDLERQSTEAKSMSLSEFFTDTLGANLKNTRWSWGAVDPMTNRVFLRVWEDQLQPLGTGEAVEVLWDKPKRKSNGYPERQKHLLQIQDGAEGFGVVCKAVDLNTDDTRNIASFDKATLLRLGPFVHQNGRTYAMINGRVSSSIIAHQATSQSTLTHDIKSILKQRIEQTTKEALVNARVGQGQFRMKVLELWEHRCCVTGSYTMDAIRASHIKPWSESTNEERLDPYNGLPLTANLDALFDVGLITFDDSGKLLVSAKLSDEEREIFSIQGCALTKAPSLETLRFLEYHRESRFDR